MTDYVDLRLFPRDGPEFLTTLDHPVYGLVSLQRQGDTLVKVLAETRDAHHVNTRFTSYIVYGQYDGGEGVLLLCNAPTHNNCGPHLYHTLETLAVQHDQPGFCYGVRGDPTGKFLETTQGYTNGTDIPMFDGSEAVFNQWAGNLLPGFKVKGYFPRDVMYVRIKLREHRVI